ncbi:hypothetical protein KAX97_15185, partial [candidate division WOR-3 bacterium]|nr:hypothetical protein [candidate division WOR-3 bacterium]
NFGNSEKGEEIDIEKLLKNGSVRGGQDNAILWISHHLRRQNESFESAFSILQAWNKRNKPIIPETELYEKLKAHYALPEAYSFYYSKDPAHFKITSNLTLERTFQKESISPNELYDMTDKGVESINRDRTCDYIESKYHFKCIKGSKMLFVYKNGIYFDSMGKLDRILQGLFGADADIRFKLEMRKLIEDRNSINANEMDAETRLLPVKNGLLNLDTLELEQFTPEKIFISGLDVVFDPDATSPAFLKAIDEVLPGKGKDVMQEVFGYCLWRDYPCEKSFWLIGDGGNGKTMLMNVLTAFLSSENVSHVALSEMDGQHRFSLYELYGSFANIIAEPETARKIESPIFKAATGNDNLVAELKGKQKRFKFASFAKQIIYANSLPQIADEKQGLWDRILPVDFPVTFRGCKNQNYDLAKELSTPESLTGILNWALEGFLRLRANNWKFTETVMQQKIKARMQIGSNPVSAFKEVWLTLSPKAEMPKQFIYDAFELFSFIHGIENKYEGSVSKEMLNDRRITTHQTRTNGRRTRVFRGCKISDDIVACYGIYRGRPLRQDELEDIETPEKEVEIRTCNLIEYQQQYFEPVEEVEEIVDEKAIIFNSEALIPLYKQQLKRTGIKHLSPQTRDSNQNESSSKGSRSLIKTISPMAEGECERCGKDCFLAHELTDENGIKSLICHPCAAELKEEQGLKNPEIFNTTLEERREMLTEEEKKK